MIYRKPAWFLEVRMFFENPHDKGSHMLLNITFVRVCIVAYITLTPYWKIYKYAPVVFWFAVRLEINIRKNRLLFSLVAKKNIYTHHYALKSWFFGLGGGVRVFTFLFHLLYIYECICIWVWGSTPLPPSLDPPTYTLISLLSSPAFLLAVLPFHPWTLLEVQLSYEPSDVFLGWSFVRISALIRHDLWYLPVFIRVRYVFNAFTWFHVMYATIRTRTKVILRCMCDPLWCMQHYCANVMHATIRTRTKAI